MTVGVRGGVSVAIDELTNVPVGVFVGVLVDVSVGVGNGVAVDVGARDMLCVAVGV